MFSAPSIDATSFLHDPSIAVDFGSDEFAFFDDDCDSANVEDSFTFDDLTTVDIPVKKGIQHLLDHQAKRKRHHDSSSDDSSPITVTMKRVKSRHQVGRKSAIAMDDVRRSLGRLFADAWNCGDDMEVTKLLQTYCVKEAVCRYKYVDASTDTVQVVEIDGIEAIDKYWAAFALAIPDFVLNIADTKLRGFPNGSSLISNHFECSGTQVAHLFTDHRNAIIISNPLNHQSTISNLSSSEKEQDQYVATPSNDGILAFEIDGESRKMLSTSYVSSTKLILGPKATPSVLKTIGTMCFYINPDKKVTRIEFIYASV